MGNNDHESVFLQGFMLHRSDFKAGGIGRPVYGLAIYVNKHNCMHSGKFEWRSIWKSWGVVSWLWSPRTDYKNYIFFIVLAGDFNWDSLAEDNLVKYMIDKCNLKYLNTSSTTNYNSALDHMYTNVLHAKLQSWGTQ